MKKEIFLTIFNYLLIDSDILENIVDLIHMKESGGI